MLRILSHLRATDSTSEGFLSASGRAGQFANFLDARPSRWIAAFLGAGLAAATVGTWVTSHVRTNIEQAHAETTARHIRSLLAPMVHELDKPGVLTDQTIMRMEAALSTLEFSPDILDFKIWKRPGLVAYSRHPGSTGRVYEESEGLLTAWDGGTVAEFDRLADEESAEIREIGVPTMEVYSPLRDAGTGRVLAVFELYEKVEGLSGRLMRTAIMSWSLVATMALALTALWYGLSVQGKRMMKRQRADLLGLLKSGRSEAARRPAYGDRPDVLREIANELHDGPTQLMSAALLRLSSLEDPKAPEGEMAAIRKLLAASIEETRSVCASAAVPGASEATSRDIVVAAIGSHEERFGDRSLAIHLRRPPSGPSSAAFTPTLPQRLCLFRFVQETLNNAQRHAPDAKVVVEIVETRSSLVVEVSDDGPGFDFEQERSNTYGLNGLMRRASMCGGACEVLTRPGLGTCLSLKFGFEVQYEVAGT